MVVNEGVIMTRMTQKGRDYGSSPLPSPTFLSPWGHWPAPCPKQPKGAGSIPGGLILALPQVHSPFKSKTSGKAFKVAEPPFSESKMKCVIVSIMELSKVYEISTMNF